MKSLVSDMVFAGTEEPVYRTVRNNKAKLSIDKQVFKYHSSSTATRFFCTVTSCEHCVYTTENCHVFEKHQDFSSHFDIFAKNNSYLHRTFCEYIDNTYNFKCHIDSKQHKRKLKNCIYKE